MSTSKHIDTICIVVLVLALILTVLFVNGEALGIQKIVDEDAETYEGTAYFTANDLDGNWDDSAATVITLNGTDASVSGSGAYAYDGGVVIANAGWYVLSGTLTDGSITVDAYNSSKVWLKFNGVDVACSDDAALRVDQAEKVFLTLAEGTSNSLASGAVYSDTAVSDNTKGVIFAHDDLTINGGGTLTVTAAYCHGIDANDDLTITGGTISVTAPEDGLHVNDSFEMAGASLTISAGDDGVHSDTSIYIESGTLLISDCYEGVEAPKIEVAGGDITIYPTDDGFNANGGSDSFGFGGFGGFGMGPSAVEETSATEETGEEEESYLLISGGTVTVINAKASDADGIDSNGSIYITGGSIRVSMSEGGYALDVGSESGGVMEISGGDLIGCGSYAMAESFDSTSTQCSILYTLSSGAEAGTTVALEDAEGNVLISYEAPCAFTCVNLSCPEMAVGETYLMVIGDNVEEITLTETSASFGDAQSSMFGGTFNMGGMQSRDDFAQDGGMGGRGIRGDTDGGTDGERPEMPDGERPEFGEMPTPPDMGGFNGEAPEFGELGERPGMPGETAPETEAAAETAAENSGDSAEIWVWVGISALVLAAGLIAALRYKRY